MSKTKTLPPNELSRRRVFAGVGSATALAAIAAVVPLAEQAGTASAKKLLAPDADGRYQVTQHVLRYYQTTQV